MADGQIGGGGDAAAVLQGGDPAIDGAGLRLRLQRGHAAVDGRDRAAERVEVGNQRILPSDWPLLQQSQLICSVEPLPSMGWAESGVWQSKLRTTTGVNWVWTKL